MKTTGKGHAMMTSAAVLQGPVGRARDAGTRRAQEAGVAASPSAAAAASDEQLFARAATGDRGALGELIERYEDFLFGLLLRMTGGDTHRAEDFFQDAFLH